MATKKAKKARPADRKETLKSVIEAAEKVFVKNRSKAANDPKRRLAHKKLKRAQRVLGKVVQMEKKAAAAKKPEGAAE